MKTNDKTGSRSHGQSHAHAATEQGTELFDQAIKNYEQALRTGVRLQEDTTRWWANFLNQSVWPQEWQKQVSTVMAHAIPTAQKNLEESLRLLDQSSKTGLNLLKRAMDGTRGAAASDAQDQVQELWNSSLNVLQSNMRAITESQSRIMESWSEFVHKGVASTRAAASSAASAAASGAR
jgi:hypothetical protein